jgi:phosphoribosylformylglycinamidine cyclo-ligase
VFSIDGIGTKTKLGMMTRRTAGLALDIIHHCLDDILCQGARGIGLMLYLGCHHRDDRLVDALLAAAEECCHSNGLVLLDRMVTEKPGLYLPGEIDLCGVIAGSVDAEQLIQGDRIGREDQIIGLPSSGLHTNGYSLARKALLEKGRFGLDQCIDQLECTLGDALLEPHRNYAPVVLPLLEDADLGEAVRGIAHITGGGLKDNLGRILPGKLEAEIYLDRWQPPPIFELIRRAGNIPLQDPVGKGMYESFNMGIGLVLVVAPEHSGRILERIEDGGCQAVVIGRVVDRSIESPGKRPAEQGGRVRLL